MVKIFKFFLFCWGVAGLARAGFRARIPATGDSGYLPAPENHTRFVDSGGNRLCGPIV